MHRFAVTINSFIFLTAMALELSGYGLISRAREGSLYGVVSDTGAGWLYVSLWGVFFLALPLINLVALLLKDRRVLIGQST